MDRVFRTFVDALHTNADVLALETAMTGITEALDLGSFAYIFATSQSDAKVQLISNYPTAWTSYYLAKGYEEIDPVIDRTVRTREPFQWGCELVDRFVGQYLDWWVDTGERHYSRNENLASGVQA